MNKLVFKYILKYNKNEKVKYMNIIIGLGNPENDYSGTSI